MQDILLKISKLSTIIPTDEGLVQPIRNLSLKIRRGRTIGLVGESGCGKTMLGLSLLQLLPPVAYLDGSIVYYDRENKTQFDIHNLNPSSKKMREIRGRKISMVFQEPMVAFNPVYTIGDQIAEAIRLHIPIDYKTALTEAKQMLSKVGFPSPDQQISKYPHELSGGLRQRAMIAMALSCNPELLIADEPTTALDVTIQAQILELLKTIKSEREMAIIIITHDLGVIADLADEIVVMYAGEIVEMGSLKQIFYQTSHPYTKGLLDASPKLTHDFDSKFYSIPGTLPSATNWPSGCVFASRCQFKTNQCLNEPPIENIGSNHFVRCWNKDQLFTKKSS